MTDDTELLGGVLVFVPGFCGYLEAFMTLFLEEQQARARIPCYGTRLNTFGRHSVPFLDSSSIMM